MSVARIITMAALAFAAFLLIISEPAEGANYISVLILTKAAGFAAAAGVAALYRVWRDDPMVSRFREWCDNPDSEINV